MLRVPGLRALPCNTSACADKPPAPGLLLARASHHAGVAGGADVRRKRPANSRPDLTGACALRSSAEPAPVSGVNARPPGMRLLRVSDVIGQEAIFTADGGGHTPP